MGGLRDEMRASRFGDSTRGMGKMRVCAEYLVISGTDVYGKGCVYKESDGQLGL